MSQSLKGKKVAILVADGFEESELCEPKAALENEGASTSIISPNPTQVTSWKKGDWGTPFKVDLPLDRAKPSDFDALLLPGGVKNPDTLRIDDRAIEFVSHFVVEQKPIGAICHGAWTLIETEGIAGRTMTSYKSIRTDLENAGVNWVDREVVVDNGLVTSRQPADIPAFNRKLIEEIREGLHTSGGSRAANM